MFGATITLTAPEVCEPTDGPAMSLQIISNPLPSFLLTNSQETAQHTLSSEVIGSSGGSGSTGSSHQQPAGKHLYTLEMLNKTDEATDSAQSISKECGIGRSLPGRS
jgi:hypothetical protein